MRAVLQRVSKANVKVDDKLIGEISKGLLILLGIGPNDNEQKVDEMVKKICNLRIFSDAQKKMNLSIKDINGEILVVSQFTLYANCQKGNRPSFVEAAQPEHANKLYEYFKEQCGKEIACVKSGIFGADMQVSLINDGPVTIILEK